MTVEHLITRGRLPFFLFYFFFLQQAAKLADEVERARKILENKGFQNDERIDSLDSSIISATQVAQDSSRKMEEASRKLAMTQVRLFVITIISSGLNQFQIINVALG